MAGEKKTIETLEARLANAATKFKEMQGQLNEKNTENEKLKARVAELEDELTLNGGAAEEVEGLKQRLEKAKEIFGTQKTRITELTEQSASATALAESLKEELEASKAEVKDLSETVDGLTDQLERIKAIVTE